jgi:glycosyltransferase involved in cell wall biosynthesis
MIRWHIITPEFPPSIGGVADYSKQVAEALTAAGDCVEIWTTSQKGIRGARLHTDLHRLRLIDFWRLGTRLDSYPAPRRVLLQWCPHGFGWRSMNVGFCLWLLGRALKGDEIDLMIHEPFLSFREGSFAQDAAALVHRLMIIILLRAARRVWVSIPAWKERIEPFLCGRHIPIVWLPIPTNVQVTRDDKQVSAIRKALTPHGEVLIGHFGTYGRGVTDLLGQIVSPLLSGKPGRRLLLIGLNSEIFREKIAKRNPEIGEQVAATGSLAAETLSNHLAACDVLLQPYPDGVSSRRTTVMAALAHGIPTVTTSGHLTEAIWRQSQGVALAPATEPAAIVAEAESLLKCEEARNLLAEQGQSMYRLNFDLSRTVENLRSECVLGQSMRI